MTAIGDARERTARSTDLVAVAAIQGGGAAMRFLFQVTLARALLPASFADVAVALGWAQVIAAAIGGGAGAYLFTSLPGMVAGGDRLEAAARYRGVVGWAVVASCSAAAVVALALHGIDAVGATAAGAAVLATAGLRSALIATQESARGLGALARSQFVTNVAQPTLAVAALGSLTLLAGAPVDPLLAAAALAVSLVSCWGAQHHTTRARLALPGAPGPPAASTPIEWRPLVRMGAASALLMWMVEGTLVMASFAIEDKVEVARFAAHVRLSVGVGIAAISVSTVASSRWSRRVRAGAAPPSLGDALRWSTLALLTGLAAGGVLLGVAGSAIGLFGHDYDHSPAVLAGLVTKDAAVGAASPLFYFLLLRDGSRAAVRASTVGAVALLAVPMGGALGDAAGASAAAAGAGLVWLGAHLRAVRTDRGPT